MKSPLMKINNAVKYAIGIIVVFLIRLIPFRIPNIEPMMATIMPFAKKFKALSGFVFGFFSIVVYDIFTSGIGVWTWVTAVMYGLVGVFASLYLEKKKNKARYYIGYSVVATLVYDAVTGIGIGMLFFHQTFMVTFLGQIPFTALHLAGNIAFAGLLSPLIYKWVIENKNLETTAVYNKVKNAFSA